MSIYSIRDLEKLTGIKAHTIRIWEQRHRLIEPARSETNIRYYTDENLRHLFNIALLNKHGYKISRIARMTPGEISARVSEITSNNASQNTQIDALTLAMINLDEATFDNILEQYILEDGFENAVLELIYPFLDKLNVLWLTNSISPAHEKFIGNLIRRKLMRAIDEERAETSKDVYSFVLFTPEGDNQELTLLFIHYLLRKRRQRVVYLGANTSINDVRDAAQALKPDYVFTLVQEPLYKQSIQQFVDYAASQLPESELLLSGAQFFIHPVRLPHNARILSGLPETQTFLDMLKPKSRNGRPGAH